MAKLEHWQLEQRQGQPLDIKEQLTINRIRAYYERLNGNVYISFSGGKDSTVLLHLVRSIYPDVPAVFVDTGLEYPEIRDFVKTVDNVIWLKPKMPFNQVIEQYGYPVISKETAQKIKEIRTTKSEKLKHKRLYGDEWGNGKLANKWQFLINAPFKISDRCCHIMKKEPFKRYEKETGRGAIVGTMAADSRLRETSYLQHGCNSFEGRPMSTPMAFWFETDVWDYIKIADSNGEAGTICLNDQGGERMDVTTDITCTLRAKSNHPPCIMDSAVFSNHSQSTCYTGPIDVAPTISATYGMGGNNQPFVVNASGDDKHAVVYAIDRETFNCGQSYAKNLGITEDGINSTLNAQGPGAVAIPTHSPGKIDYTVRRLTPTECARLQGFPDWWCKDLGTETPTMNDLQNWQNIFEIHRKATGAYTKPKTLKQIEKWLRDPHSDSAEYKMWGNGVALPNVYFVLSGIVWFTQKGETENYGNTENR